MHNSGISYLCWSRQLLIWPSAGWSQSLIDNFDWIQFHIPQNAIFKDCLFEYLLHNVYRVEEQKDRLSGINIKFRAVNSFRNKMEMALALIESTVLKRY